MHPRTLAPPTSCNTFGTTIFYNQVQESLKRADPLTVLITDTPYLSRRMMTSSSYNTRLCSSASPMTVMYHDNRCIDGLKDSGLKSINGYSDKENEPDNDRVAYLRV